MKPAADCIRNVESGDSQVMHPAKSIPRLGACSGKAPGCCIVRSVHACSQAEAVA